MFQILIVEFSSIVIKTSNVGLKSIETIWLLCVNCDPSFCDFICQMFSLLLHRISLSGVLASKYMQVKRFSGRYFSWSENVLKHCMVFKSQNLTDLSHPNEIKWFLFTFKASEFTAEVCPCKTEITLLLKGFHIKISLSSPQLIISLLDLNQAKSNTPFLCREKLRFT